MSSVAPLKPGDTVGILGGGQLGRMLAIAAAQLGLRTHIFAPEEESPAAEVSGHRTRAGYTDADALKRFADICDVVTFEFENIPRASLDLLAGALPLRPGIRSLATSQDRLIEKQFLKATGLAVAPYEAVDGLDAIAPALKRLGGDAILKTRRLGYDGKGQVRLTQSSDLEKAWNALGNVPCVLEERIAFQAEVSAVIARGTDGQAVAYDVPVNRHENGILNTSAVGSFADPQIDPGLAREAQEAAIAIADALGHVGVLTAEFFVTDSNDLLVNEIAPRVHNSGHWTLDACTVSQFDNHVRAVAGWPLGSIERHSDARMTNLIGADSDAYEAWLADSQAALHLYGKSDARPGRKMGHATHVRRRDDR